ncbi:HD-GYP domain-containing protein [Undibacterium sp. SXout11W]|uniref:HD-GYP domain-containing protein n=1 Tax=Undibacterium sp. SXout11W TaxID=3413050 RepID=UPI003BF22DE8
MSQINKQAARRIALVSLLLAIVSAPLAWFVSTEGAENSVVSLAIEESSRLLRHFNLPELTNESAKETAKSAVETLSGGLFDIAELYNAEGVKLAESLTDHGSAIEDKLPRHKNPHYKVPFYESFSIQDQWVLRVFVPLKMSGSEKIIGYFEGVRLVPDWQRKEINSSAYKIALIACLASVLCGITIYPIVVNLSLENSRRTIDVLNSHIYMMEALGRATAKRDSDTGAHNYRVAWISARIGEQMHFNKRQMQALIAGSLLHDVGKIGIPDAILLKPGRLDEAEMSIMRTHVTQGEDIVKGMGWLDGASEVVAGHHEKWNGSGYPRRLKGEAIPLSARIFAVADVFDALSSKRPYKEAMPFDLVMEALRRETGIHFDPQIMGIFEQIADEIRDALQDNTEVNARRLLEVQIRNYFKI